MTKIFVLISFLFFASLSTVQAQDKNEGKPVRFTSSTYQADIAQGVVLVDYWAPWCAPCRKLAPILDDIAKDKTLGVKVGKLNIDNDKTFAIDKGVKSIPTMILYKNGKEITRFVGLYTKEELKNSITNALK